jgi:predicted nucleotidyltransferase/biotin operon repressor
VVDVARPYTAISPSVDTAVLIVLAGSSAPRSGREIARRTGRSKTGVQHVLERLVDQGIVERLPTGNAHLYSLNRDHLLARAVELMANTHTELIRRLRDMIDSWQIPAVHASLFGSTARGDGDARSDIDLLIVGPADPDVATEPWRAQIDALAENVRRWTGNNAGIVEISEADLPRLAEEQPPILAELRSDAIRIAGKPTRTLLREL